MMIVLRDTNGGNITGELTEIMTEITSLIPPHLLGIHAHNDCGFAVANSLSAVNMGAKMVQEIKNMEDQGYQFDAADESLALLIKKATGEFTEPFILESFRVIDEKTENEPSKSQAMIKISVGDEKEITAAEGNGPVNTLGNALRKALRKFYPQIDERCIWRILK